MRRIAPHVPRLPRALLALGAGTLALASAACERRDAHPTAPAGGAMARYVAIGADLSMGVQSLGVLYSTQAQAWPALLARQAGAEFAQPLLRTPGCTPPLIAPLRLARFLSGASAAVRDSSCAGALAAVAPPPYGNLALAGATAWAALELTPRIVAAGSATYGAADRARYPLVLGPTQSQVTALRVQQPTFVSVELGTSELLGATTTGLLVAAASYEQAAASTYVPAAVFAPVYAAIADSVKRSGARAVLLGVPRLTRLAALRAGADLYADRAAFAALGITVTGDCQSSTNQVFTPALVPALAARALVTVSAQTLSCADVPGTADFVLTPGDVATLDAAVDAMNAQIRDLADANGWAYGDVSAAVERIRASRAAYSVVVELGCVLPYGQFLSLDGVHPNVAGQQLLANAAAEAMNARYGFTIPAFAVPDLPQAALCPP